MYRIDVKNSVYKKLDFTKVWISQKFIKSCLVLSYI